MTTEKLSARTKIGFGVCDLGGNLFFTALGFWSLNYLTDTVGIAAGLAGAAVMVGKLWDAVTDPMMGFISDRTRTRWGRRRPYMLLGAVPLMLAMWFFFTGPSFGSQAALAVWAALALMFLNTAYTVVNIPYSSLTPELTSDYHERSSLNGYRFIFATIGTILGAAAVQPIVGAFADKRAGFSAAGLILGAVMAATALATVFSVKEKKLPEDEIPSGGFFKTYFSVFKNRPYLILIGAYALNITGLNFLQGILVYYTKYVYRDEGLTTLAMVSLLAVAMVCIPLSVLVSKRFGKKRTYQFAFAVLAVGCMVIYLFGHTLGPKFFLAMMVWAGVGIGFGNVMPWAMLPDAIEYDALKSGTRKEGAFYGMWTFVSKVGQSLSILLSGAILALGGYVAEATQSASSIGAIRLLIGPIPAVLLVAALVVVERYPLDKASYDKLIAEEKARGIE